nr:MAG TPA: hypothetical protein [Caudoviricetes sp.]
MRRSRQPVPPVCHTNGRRASSAGRLGRCRPAPARRCRSSRRCWSSCVQPPAQQIDAQIRAEQIPAEHVVDRSALCPGGVCFDGVRIAVDGLTCKPAYGVFVAVEDLYQLALCKPQRGPHFGRCGVCAVECLVVDQARGFRCVDRVLLLGELAACALVLLVGAVHREPPLGLGFGVLADADECLVGDAVADVHFNLCLRTDEVLGVAQAGSLEAVDDGQRTVVVHDVVNLGEVDGFQRPGVVVILAGGLGQHCALDKGHAEPLTDTAGEGDLLVRVRGELGARLLEDHGVVVRGAQNDVGAALCLDQLGADVDGVLLGIGDGGGRGRGRAFVDEAGNARDLTTFAALLNREGQVLIAQSNADLCGLHVVDLLGLLEVVVQQDLDQVVAGFLVGEAAAGLAGGDGGSFQLVDVDAACGPGLVLVGTGCTGHENGSVEQVRLQNRRILLVYVLRVDKNSHFVTLLVLFLVERIVCVDRVEGLFVAAARLRSAVRAGRNAEVAVLLRLLLVPLDVIEGRVRLLGGLDLIGQADNVLAVELELGGVKRHKCEIRVFAPCTLESAERRVLEENRVDFGVGLGLCRLRLGFPLWIITGELFVGFFLAAFQRVAFRHDRVELALRNVRTVGKVANLDLFLRVERLRELIVGHGFRSVGTEQGFQKRIVGHSFSPSPASIWLVYPGPLPGAPSLSFKPPEGGGNKKEQTFCGLLIG